MHVQKTRFRFWACLLQHKHKRTVVKLTLSNVTLEVLQGGKNIAVLTTTITCAHWLYVMFFSYLRSYSMMLMQTIIPLKYKI